MPAPTPLPAVDPIPTPTKPKKRKPGRPKEPPKPCAVNGCTRHARARGLCMAHYKRRARNGGPGRAKIACHAGDVQRFAAVVALNQRNHFRCCRAFVHQTPYTQGCLKP